MLCSAVQCRAVLCSAVQFKSVQSIYVASYFQLLTACGANSVLVVSLVEVERSPELSRHLLQMVVQSVLGQVNRLVLKNPVLVSAE